MIERDKAVRYFDNCNNEMKRQAFICLLYGNEFDKTFIKQQIEDFDRLWRF